MTKSATFSHHTDEKKRTDATIPNPFAVRAQRDAEQSSSTDREEVATRIEKACLKALSDSDGSQKYRPRVGFFTLTNFCIITTILTICEFAFILYGASIIQVVALGAGELVLYTLVGIGAMIDLHQYRKQSRHSPIADRLSFLADEVYSLEQLRAAMQSEAGTLRQSCSELEHNEKAARYSLGKLELNLAELHESVDELEAVEKEKMDSIARQKGELEDLNAATILTRERAEQLRVEVDALVAAREESLRMKESAHSELIRIETELQLNRVQQDEIALKLGGLNEKVEVASQKLEQQEFAFVKKQDELARTSATVDEKLQLQREIDSQAAMLESLKQAEAALTAKLEDAEAAQKIEEMEKRREQLQGQIDWLEKRLHQRQVEQQGLVEQNERLDITRKQSESELKELQHASELARNSLTSLIATQDELNQVVEGVRDEVERREHQRTGLMNLLEDGKQNLASIQQEVDQAIVALANAERRTEQVQARTDSLNELVEMRSQDVLKIKQELIELRAELRAGQDSLAALDAAKSELDSANAQLAELQLESEHQKAQIDSQSIQLDTATASLREVTAAIHAAEDEIRDRQKSLADLNQHFGLQTQALELSRGEMAVEIDSHEQILGDRLHEISSLQADLASLVSEYELTAKELAENRAQIQRERTEAENERDVIANNIDIHQGAFDSLQHATVTLQKEIESLGNARLLIQQELDRSQEAVHQAEWELATLSDKRADQQRLHTEWVAGNEQLATLAASHQREIERHAQELSTLALQLDRVSQELHSKQNELEKSKHEVATKRDELATLGVDAKRAETLAKEAKDLELRVALHQRTIEQLAMEEQELVLRLERQQRERQVAIAESERLEAKTRELQNSLVSHNSTLRDEQLALEELFNRQRLEQQKLTNLTNALADAQDRIAKSELTAKANDARVTDSETRLRKLESEIAEAQQIGNQWDAYVATMRTEGEQLLKRKQEIEFAVNQTQMMKQNIMDELKRIENAVHRNQSELYQLESKVTEARDRASSLTSEINELTTQRNRCGKELDAKERRLAEVARELDHLELTIERQKDASTRELKKLQEQEAAKTAVNMELAKIVSNRDAAQHELEQLTTRALQAQDKLGDLQRQVEVVQRDVREADATRQELQRLRIEQAEAERNASVIRLKIEEANAVYERLLVDADQETARLQAMQVQSNALQQQLSLDTVAASELEARQQKLSKQCLEAANELALREEQTVRVKQTLRTTESELELSAHKLDELREQWLELDANRSLCIDAVTALDRQKQESETALQQVQQRLNETQTQLQADVHQAEVQAREMAERETQLHGLRTVIIAIESQKVSVQTELGEYERLRSLAVERLQQLQEKLLLGIQQEQDLERQFQVIAEQHRVLQANLNDGQAAKESLQRELEMESRLISRLRAEREKAESYQSEDTAPSVAEPSNRIQVTSKVSRSDRSEPPVAKDVSDTRVQLNNSIETSRGNVRIDESSSLVSTKAGDRNRTTSTHRELDMWEEMLSELQSTQQEINRDQSNSRVEQRK